jgi:hypothetical protein
VSDWARDAYGDPCRECGHVWTTSVGDATAVLTSALDTLEPLVAGATGRERHAQLGWTVAGYVAHVGDNLSIWAERLVSVARGADSSITLYDNELLATARRYNELPLPGPLWTLRAAANRWASAVREADAAHVVLRHPERGPMPVVAVAAANVHDAAHHVFDIRRTLEDSASSSR